MNFIEHYPLVVAIPEFLIALFAGSTVADRTDDQSRGMTTVAVIGFIFIVLDVIVANSQ